MHAVTETTPRSRPRGPRIRSLATARGSSPRTTPTMRSSRRASKRLRTSRSRCAPASWQPRRRRTSGRSTGCTPRRASRSTGSGGRLWVAEWTLSGALNAALRDALIEDPRVLVFGEDVGRSGGVFRVTDGLQQEFGAERVFDTPASEAAIAGAAVGLAFAGWRSVIEMQFDAFSYPALEQVIDHVAKMRVRVRGRVDIPITIRIPSFG